MACLSPYLKLSRRLSYPNIGIRVIPVTLRNTQTWMKATVIRSRRRTTKTIRIRKCLKISARNIPASISVYLSLSLCHHARSHIISFITWSFPPFLSLSQAFSPPPLSVSFFSVYSLSQITRKLCIVDKLLFVYPPFLPYRFLQYQLCIFHSMDCFFLPYILPFFPSSFVHASMSNSQLKSQPTVINQWFNLKIILQCCLSLPGCFTFQRGQT